MDFIFRAPRATMRRTPHCTTLDNNAAISHDSIYDTSIIKVADILCRNFPYYVAYTRTWIFEPSVYLSGCKIE